MRHFFKIVIFGILRIACVWMLVYVCGYIYLCIHINIFTNMKPYIMNCIAIFYILFLTFSSNLFFHIFFFSLGLLFWDKNKYVKCFCIKHVLTALKLERWWPSWKRAQDDLSAFFSKKIQITEKKLKTGKKQCKLENLKKTPPNSRHLSLADREICFYFDYLSEN